MRLKFLMLLLAVLGTNFARAQDVELIVNATEGYTFPSSSNAYSYAIFNITSNADLEAEIQLVSNDWGAKKTTTKTVLLKKGNNRVLMEYLCSYSMSIFITSKMHSIRLYEGSGSARTNTIYFSPDNEANLIFAVMQDSDFAAGTTHLINKSFGLKAHAPEQLPANWAAYTGLTGLIYIDHKYFTKFSQEQKDAISTWVKFWGGTVCFAGSNAKEMAGSFNFKEPDKGRITNIENKINLWRSGFGKVWLMENGGLKDLSLSTLQKNTNLGSDSRHSSNDEVLNLYSNWKELIKGLNTLPLIAIAIVIGVMILIMGPLNLFVVQHKKKKLLFFITTPIIGITGCIIIVVMSIINQGVTPEYREEVLLVQLPKSTEGCIYRRCGIYSPLNSVPLKYPEKTFAAPDNKDENRNSMLFTDTTGNQLKLLGGWVNARTVSCIQTARPLECRMGLELLKDGDNYSVINTLDHNALKVTYSNGKGKVFVGENIQPGQTGSLKPAKNINDIESQQRDTFRHFTNKYTSSQLPRRCLFAELEGLPYINRGGGEGNKHSGKYYYLCPFNTEENNE